MRGLTFALMLSVAVPAAAMPSPPAQVTRAVAATAQRSPDNVKLDASRKPAEVLRFFGLRQGMHVLDLFGANHYWAEIIAPAVGPQGRVTVWEPTQFYGDKAKADFAKFNAGHANVSIIASPFEAPVLPARAYDFALINLDYHDTYWESAKYGIPRMEPAKFLATLYATMKPGGVVGVIDHVASPNADTRATVEALHRIDPAVLLADFKRAGFVLEARSSMLRNPADDHSLNVFDPKIRGKTDRAIFKFRKPRR